MVIGVPKETAVGERRVALVPDTVTSFKGKDLDVAIESGAGEAAGHPDSHYSDAGATVGNAGDAYGADIVVGVGRPTAEGFWRRRMTPPPLASRAVPLPIAAR